MANFTKGNGRGDSGLQHGAGIPEKAGSGAHLQALVIQQAENPTIEDQEGFWQELREELLLLETRAGLWLLQAADPSCLGRIYLQQRIESGEAVVMSGEIICDRDIQCLQCGSTFHAHGSVTLTPCQACGAEAYGSIISH